MGNDLTVALDSAAHPRARKNFRFAGEEPRSIPGQKRFSADATRVEPFTAGCAHTGANHLSILHEGRANMVQCTAADTMGWIRSETPLPTPR
jgi:hypothetical protein